MNRTLFDDAPSDEAIRASIDADFKRLRRTTDPDTSADAARHVTGRLGDIQRWVLNIVKEWPGCTASELADAKGVGDIRQINRRLPELEALGRIRRGETRRCSVTGHGAATWWPV